MTDLRDARLRQALDAAPDAGLQPQARTREAIHAAARAAVQPAWRRWWRPVGRSGTPWAAAFATLMVATLVTVLWNDEEVPGARTEPAGEPVAAAPQAAAKPEVPAAPAVQPAPQPAPPPAPTVLPESAKAPAPAPRPGLAITPQGRAASPSVVPAPAAPSAPSAPAVAPAPAPATAPPAAMADAAQPAPQALEERRSAPALARAPAPPPAAAPPAPLAAAAPAARARAEAATFTQVRVEAGGRSLVLPADQAGLLPALVVRLFASPAAANGVTAGTASLRLELARGNEALGVLERLGEHWRWTPVEPGQAPRLLRPAASLDEDLREEVARLLR